MLAADYSATASNRTLNTNNTEDFQLREVQEIEALQLHADVPRRDVLRDVPRRASFIARDLVPRDALAQGINQRGPADFIRIRLLRRHDPARKRFCRARNSFYV